MIQKIDCVCPTCGYHYRFSAENAGKNASCRSCQHLFAIPLATVSKESENESGEIRPRRHLTIPVHVASVTCLVACVIAGVTGFSLFFIFSTGFDRTSQGPQPRVADKNQFESNELGSIGSDQEKANEFTDKPLGVNSDKMETNAAPPEASDASSSVVSNAAGTLDDPHNQGRRFESGDFAYQVVFASWVERLGTRYDSGDARQHLVVCLMLQNMASTPRNAPSVALVSDGMQFAAPGRGIMLHPLWFGRHQRLNPTMGHYGLLAFEIPGTAVPLIKLGTGNEIAPIAYANLGEIKRFADLDDLAESFVTNPDLFGY